MATKTTNYWGVTRALGGWALGAFLFGLLFKPIIQNIFPADLRDDVIILALPFVAYFAAILLLFILGINLISQRLHLSIPNRTHRAVEYTIIAGILFGIFALFQPWTIGPYRFGFGLLLLSTLAFILWSHVMPRRAKDDSLQPPYTKNAVTAGLIVGLLITALIAGGFALTSRPKEPYGIRERQWNFMREDQKVEIATKANRDYFAGYLPFFLVYGLLPGLVGFFLIREFATPKASEEASV
ncbi:MAG: hypothetical protein KC422_03535 [Trueperaceae bacterium]|nr:hypothetical protein [Trueperaceae bacterium]